ncbi:hypothetical protein [Donghicola sp.]|jgi:hypothetical protein|uniref:hypothetical protein n=1 Tax=Donghicola sp. TaxID=1929294 RepID=UPI0025F8D52A|nr:hypothetical protein [Donghicola sp.]MCT4579586.1 hypothetical protein [Donghicola sp.]
MIEPKFQERSGSIVLVGCVGLSRLLGDFGKVASNASNVIVFDPRGALDPKDEYAVPSTTCAKLPAAGFDENVLRIYSLPGLVSVGCPTIELTDVFPGLKEVGKTHFNILTGNELIASLSGLAEPVQCVIDLPGAEAQILDAFLEAEFLYKLNYLTIRCGVERFFDGALDKIELTNRLLAHDFYLDSENTDDADWPILRFKANVTVRQLKVAEKELADSNRRERAHVEYIAQLKSELEDSRAKLISATAEKDIRNGELSQCRTKVEETLKRLREADDARTTQLVRIDELSSELTEKRDALNDARTELQQKSELLDNVEAELSIFRKEATALEEKRTHIEQELIGKRDLIESLRAELSAVTPRLEAAEKAKADANAEQSFLSRMNALLQSDLNHLRLQFQKSEDDRRRQEDLLLKLTPKLAQAAEHLQQLQVRQKIAPENLQEPKTTERSSRRSKKGTKQLRPNR